MISGLQPTRPKPPQQQAVLNYTHQQQRTTHATSSATQPLRTAPKYPLANPLRPGSQIEAMPPSRPAAAPTVFDSAIRHPVFFTENLRKPPFPIPQIASHGWSPVASGYIMEQQRAMQANPSTKL